MLDEIYFINWFRNNKRGKSNSIERTSANRRQDDRKQQQGTSSWHLVKNKRASRTLPTVAKEREVSTYIENNTYFSIFIL